MINFVELFSGAGTAEGSLFAVKLTILIAEVLYAMFAFVVLRQVSLMNNTFKTEYAGFFKFIARIHFLTVLAVIVFSLILL